TATLAGDTMGTHYRVNVVAPRHSEQDLQAGIEQRLDEVDAAMSTWRADSELSRFNAQAVTDWVAVSPALHVVLQTAAAISEITDGAFDVTVGPLVNLWGFGPDRRPSAPPADTALAAARARVGHRLLHLADAPPRVRKDRGDVYVDLSAIAKGYAVDRVADWLAATGYRDFLVEVGGEIRSRGRRADGSPWQVGVAWPDAGSADVARVLPLGDTALATSGDYRQYFEFAGRRYSHEIDPVTGRPIAHALASVTVLDAACMRADALATGLLVLGPERGPALARRLGISALFLVHRESGFQSITTGAFPPAQ
ncbi:MAG: FAD:protein FMN transferase, partial [Gammaproteobacteria bacterium]